MLLYASIDMKSGFSVVEILIFIVGISAIIAIAGTVIFISFTNIEDPSFDSTQNIQDIEKENQGLKGNLNVNTSESGTQNQGNKGNKYGGKESEDIYCADKNRNTVELGLLSGASKEQKEWYLKNCK